MAEKGDSSGWSSVSEGDLSGFQVTRASERERVVLYPDNPAESYIVLYTNDYLADDDVWNRRCYPSHVPEEVSDQEEQSKRGTGPGGQQRAE